MSIRSILLVHFQHNARQNEAKIQEIFISLAELEVVEGAYLTTGPYDAVLRIRVQSEEEWRQVSGDISKMPGVSSVNPLRITKTAARRRRRN